MKALIPLHEAAQLLGVHVTTLRAWVRTGEIPSYRIGQRFTRVDWNELLAKLAADARELAGENATRGGATGRRNSKRATSGKGGVA